jgi:hypothetical protein
MKKIYGSFSYPAHPAYPVKSFRVARISCRTWLSGRAVDNYPSRAGSLDLQESFSSPNHHTPAH